MKTVEKAIETTATIDANRQLVLDKPVPIPVKGREQSGQRQVLVLSIDAINKLPLVVSVVVGTTEVSH